jgi:hypothetical protein
VRYGLGSFTRRKLKQLHILGSLAFLEMETARRSSEAAHLWCTLPYRTWHHGVAFPASLRFEQTYASCIDQLYIRLIFALSAVMSFVVMGADYTYAIRLCQRPVAWPADIRSD